MTAFNGIGTAVGLGPETTYGTAVARTNWVQLTGLSGPGLQRNYAENPLLPDQATREAPVSTRTDWALRLSTLATYEGFGVLWYYLTGTTPVTTGGSSPYTHVFDMSSTMPTSLTAEIIRGNADKSEIATGVKIDRASISVSADQYMRVDFDLIGDNSTKSTGSAPTPTYTTARNPVTAWHAGDFNYNSNTYCCAEFNVTVARNHSQPTMMGCSVQPVPSYANVTGTIRVEYDGEDWYDVLRNETSDDGHITFTSGSQSLRFDLHNMVIKSVTRDVSDPDRIMQVIEFEAYADSSDSGLKITAVNTQANYNDN